MLQRSIYLGLQEGIAGPLYLVARARLAGYDITALADMYESNLSYLRNSVFTDIDNQPSGLYTGSIGIAVALAEGIRAGLIQDAAATSWVQTCLVRPCEGTDLAVGAAGKALGLLHALDLLPASFVLPELTKVCNSLVEMQERDGSWKPFTARAARKIWKVTGFAHGVAGIAYVLLLAGQCAADQHWIAAGERALNWLERAGSEKDEYMSWTMFAGQNVVDNWVADGIAGIPLAFLEAYKITGKKRYAQIAGKSLNCYPRCRVDFALSHNHGLAGLGEVYLQAYTILGDNEWIERATWIAHLLSNAYCQQGNDIFWLSDHTSIPTADLLAGNSGIVHFMLRYNKYSKMKYLLEPQGCSAT